MYPTQARPEHAEAHARDHQQWSRRSFLRQLGLAGTAALLLNRLPLHAVGASPLAAALATAGNDDRVLVLIRLKGGNDGLNTIVPVFDYGAYQALRPTLALPRNQLIGLNDELALSPGLAAAQSFWQSGAMRIVNNVGYENHNLSHFRSTDIWTSASNANDFTDSGWLGRLLDRQYPDYLTNPPPSPLAIQIGGNDNLTFDDEEGFNLSVGTANPEQLARIAQTGELYDPAAVPPCYYGEQVGFLRAVANTTSRYSQVIYQAYQNAQNTTAYPNRLGEQLALVARLIRGGLATRLYLVTLDGFDTHANQPDQHTGLLANLAESVAAFYADLAPVGRAGDVLAMTFSEFGRRPEQNASRGTDHGAAAPLLLFGGGLNGNGFLGGLPDLQDLDPAGNLRFEVDFRQIYATVLEQWLCVEASTVDAVLGRSFERLPLGLSCSLTSTQAPPAAPDVQLTAFRQDGQLVVTYDLPQTADVEVSLHDLLGRPVGQLYRGRQAAGEQQLRHPLSDVQWAAGIYIVTLRTGGRIYSRKISLMGR